MSRIRHLVTVLAVSACRHSKPAPPLDDMVTIAAQSYVGDDLTCPAGTQSPRFRKDVTRVPLTVRGFKIDRVVVGCEDYERCVEAGACAHSDDVMRCLDGIAAVRRAAASSYCTWRRARIPSWKEWQLAVRGPDACEYPTCHDHKPEYDVEGSEISGQPVASAFGVVYRWDAHSWIANEVTSDDDCWLRDPADPSSLSVGHVSGFTAGALHESLDLPGTERGAFRCVRE